MARMEMDCILRKWRQRFRVCSFCLGKLAKTLIMAFFFSFKFTWYLFLWVFHKLFLCTAKVRTSNLRQFLNQKTWKITMTKPLQVELFWQKRLFLPGVPKLKPFWPKHTVLSRFCQNKVISVKTHSFKQLLLKSSYFGQNHCFEQLLTK